MAFGKKFQALGRLKPGEMNKTEARFAAYLRAQQLAGEVLWFKFDAVKLRLADNCFLTVDFFILNSKNELQAIDVKGSLGLITDDARAKMKVAAQDYPWPFFYAVERPKKAGGGWIIQEV